LNKIIEAAAYCVEIPLCFDNLLPLLLLGGLIALVGFHLNTKAPVGATLYEQEEVCNTGDYSLGF
jgi:hypothetical protein